MTLPDEEPEQEEGLIKPFLGHLDDLRRVLVWSAGALFCGMVAAVFLVPRMFVLLKLPLLKDPCMLFQAEVFRLHIHKP